MEGRNAASWLGKCPKQKQARGDILLPQAVRTVAATAPLGSALFETAKKAESGEEFRDCNAQAADE